MQKGEAHKGPGPSRTCQPARSNGQANPFLEPWILESARRNLLTARDQLTVAGETRRIAVPLTIERMPGRLFTVARVWGHDHCYDTTPPSTGECRDNLEPLFAALADCGIDILRWPLLPMDTAFAGALIEFLDDVGLAYEKTKSYRRPLLVCDASSAEGFLKRHVSKGRLKDLRRRRRRMDDLGDVEFLIHEGPHDAAGWCRDFMDLEASGWKGPSGTGTAIRCCDRQRTFFETVAAEGAAAGRIVVHSLTLNGKPIAMTVNFRSDAWLWAYKSAYREDLGHLAPGVQVELEGSRAVLNDPSLVFFDSCMTTERGVLAELWPDRRPIADLLIAIRPGANRAVRAGGLLWRQYLALKKTVAETFGTRASPAIGGRSAHRQHCPTHVSGSSAGGFAVDESEGTPQRIGGVSPLPAP